MTTRLSRWGVGPKIALTALSYAVLAAFMTWRWPVLFRMHGTPYEVLRTLAALLFAIGVPLLIFAARSCVLAYNSDKLITSGVFRLVRHPIYSAWIVFILPGLAMLSGSWLQLATPLLAYAAFKKLIRREEEYLRQRFGAAYLEYRARVNEIVPLPRVRQR